MRELSDIVLMHHERFDGKGYPIVGIDVLDNWDEITSVVNR